MANKVFIGTWVSKETRKKLKMKCAERDIHQSDVITFLIEGWLDKPHIKEGVDVSSVK